MMTFEEYLSRGEDIEEDEMVAAAPSASGMVSGPKGTTAGDILGKCSHDGHGGFMSKDCNHIPKPLMLEPKKRRGKAKKQKVFLVTDAEFDGKPLKLTEDQIMEFIADNFDVSYYDINQVDDIAWVQKAKTMYIKFQVSTASSILTKFVEAQFDGKKLLPTDDAEVVDAKAGKKKFSQKHPGLDGRDFLLCWQ